MTQFELRRKYVDTAESFLGAKQGGEKHREIVDAYNSYLPHPRGYALTMKDSWCAAFVSACAILCGLSEIIPVECSCGEQIKLWQRMGRWEERDDYLPSAGDLIYYDWQDDGKGDNTGAADHVGIVTSAVFGEMAIVEGNKGSSHIVGYRHIPVGGKTIRGFGLPDYAAIAAELCTPELPILQRGATGEAVRALQALLNLRTAAGLKLDASFGPATQKEVRAYQSFAGIAVDGSVGPVTWGRLING